MKKLSLLLTSCFFVLITSGLFAQISGHTSDKKARKLYNEGKELIDAYREYPAGVKKLQEAIARDPNYVDAHRKLGNTYVSLNMRNQYLSEIKTHYGKVAEIQPDIAQNVTIYLELAKIYLKEGSYAIADDYIKRILKHSDYNKRATISAKKLKETCDFALEGIQNPLDFNPQLMSKEAINRYAFNSHPILTADNSMMILSVRNRVGNRDENIVFSRFQNGKWSLTENISENINTRRNEGMASISGDGKTLVLTSCDRQDSKGGCDLYISTKTGDEWSIPENMGDSVNTHAKESSASLSADGRTIYFCSRRKGGVGESDIYVTRKDDDGSWSKAEILSRVINTKYNEVTPFIHADGENLYFASQGHAGYGGYDIFHSKLTDDGWSVPQNIGYPINTASNEGSLYITPDYEKGYYEKYEDKAGQSFSLVYEFDFPEEIKAQYRSSYMKGNVYDAITKKPIEANVELTDVDKAQRNQLVSSDKKTGEYLVVLREGKEYALHVDKEGYLYQSLNFNFKKSENFDPLTLDIYMNPVKSGVTTVLSNLFYETDKFDLDDKSKTELNKLVEYLKDHSEIKVEIGGHTDNQGSVSYNQKLSTNRAKTVSDYLLQQGVIPSRVKYKGYNQSKPIVSNDTKENRAKNRRIEIKIL